MRRKRHRKTKEKTGFKRIKHRIYALLVILLGIAIISLSVLLLFRLQRIQIEGNDYCTDTEIQQMVQNDKYSVNTLYIWGKYLIKQGKVLPCLDNVKISFNAPWAIKVTIVEKPITGYLMAGKEYAYFDKEGLVVRKTTSKIKEVPQIEGLDIKKVELYKKLQSKDSSGLFEEFLKTTKELDKYEELNAERIVCRDDCIYLYFKRICVNLGNSVSSEKIAQIPPIMEKLGKQKGVLHLENYSGENSTITFDKGKLPKEN